MEERTEGTPGCFDWLRRAAGVSSIGTEAPQLAAGQVRAAPSTHGAVIARGRSLHPRGEPRLSPETCGRQGLKWSGSRGGRECVWTWEGKLGGLTRVITGAAASRHLAKNGV